MKSKLLTLILVCTLSSTIGLKAQELNQRKQLFDFGWKFYLGDEPKAGTNNFDDKAWRTLDLPHDWSIEGVVNPKNPTGNDGGYFPAGIGWYRKNFIVPSGWKGHRISIYFEGVYMNSEVFINGKSLGIHPYGYTSFFYDLTQYINYDKENSLSVRVDNSKQKNCRWYSGSGIYRHVWMLVTAPVHIANWGIAVTTPNVSAEKATVQVKTLLKNETNQPQNMVIETQIFDAKANKIGLKQRKVALLANSEKEISQTIPVSNPLLWTPQTPYLYQAMVQVLKGKKVIDLNNTNFGIRSIKFSAENGFQLNGKTVKMNGGCVHHDNGCLGAAAFDRAEERRVELLKAAGFNALRLSHNPPSEAFLSACDRLGMLVIDEAFDGWKEQKTPFDYASIFKDWWQKDVESMVLRDRNHPSIIMWSIGNEIIERAKPEAVETSKMLANYVRKMDSTRPITLAVNKSGKNWAIFDTLMAVYEVSGYNYELHRATADHERVPSRIMVQTESVANATFSSWKLVRDYPYIIGDFVWTAMDYLGESGIGRYYYSGEVPGESWDKNPLFPWHGAYCGNIDLMGWRKPISHYRNMLYTHTEKLYMAVREPNPEPFEIKETSYASWPSWENWSWPAYEGKDIKVEVFSTYPKVRLYLNKKLVDEKQTTEKQEFKALFTVPYASGELKAIGVENEKEVETTTFQTAGDAAQIKLVADRTEISATGQDLSFVAIQITDKNGILQPNANNRLQFKLEGEGIIAGADNANLKDIDKYVTTSRKAWNGRALVVIKSTKNAGDIKLTVSSKGLSDAIIKIKSKKQPLN